MFKNYLKTAIRSMARSKLFTSINIIGLAISMSVGLLMITFISDLLSYDDFHKNKENIYRVLTTNHEATGHVMTLASTSVKAGYKIRETISGIEELTQIRRGFGGDAEIGDNKIPMTALWADNSFPKVFTYPFLRGDEATALQEPYSLVLTEKSANKLFGKTDAMGKTVKFDSLNYTVTGILKDIPKLSHLNFEALVSFSTVELQKPAHDGDFLGWGTFYDNYTYILREKNQDLQLLQARLDQLSKTENATIEGKEITLSLQPLGDIAIGNTLVNELGLHLDIIAIWVLIALTFIVLLSACFNYTNLSIARALKRTREVGIRKVIGAKKGQVVAQFITESVVVSFISLALSFLLFLFLREQTLNFESNIRELATFDISVQTVASFVILALLIGLVAGVFPALFFSRVKALQVLKGISSLRLFQRVKLRKSLIVIQYAFSLIFITATVIGYNQYKSFITYDLGFNTENILNIRLQGNNADLVIKRLSEIPQIEDIAKSRIVTSLGSIYGTQLKYKDPNDSIMVRQNIVDEHYLSIHGHQFLAGENFTHRPESAAESEVIVNEKLLKRFNIASDNVASAIGEVVTVEGKELTIIGVLKDFHYEQPEQAIEPVIMRYSENPGDYINVKIIPGDWMATLASVENAWQEIDKVHPLEAKLYKDQIELSYRALSLMVKIVGFLSFLAICIASLGLFGMVVFTTETKLKEISIRKVLGAKEGNLIYLLSKNFIVLLGISALIALPITYLFFDKVLLTHFANHAPIGLSEMLVGFLGVLLIAFVMIGTQTFRAALANPVKSLRTE